MVGKWHFVLGCFLCMVGILFMARRSFRLPLDRVMHVEPIRAPAPGLWPDTTARSEEAEQRACLVLRHFEDFMDSLRKDAKGRASYDSVLESHPGIVDSAKEAEKYFYLQKLIK
jgi:hypothetical protein